MLEVFVLGTLPGDVSAMVAAVSALGIDDLSRHLAPLDDEMAAVVDRADVPGLVARARRRLPAPPWVLGTTGLAVTLPVWREAAPGSPVAVVVDTPPASVRDELTRNGRCTEAVALARWERSSRLMLQAVAGLPTLVVRPSAATAAQVAAFLRDADPPARAVAAPAPSQPGLSPAQAGLHRILTDLDGAHPRFVPPDLPQETPSTGLLVEADRGFERRLADLERSLATALDAVEGLALPEPPPPLPFEPAYGLDAAEDTAGYARWLDRERQRQTAGRPTRDLPAIGVVVVVNHPDPALLERCAASITAQTHAGWQLRLGHTGDAATAARLAATDDRIRATGPAADAPAAGNAAAALVDAPFLTFIGQHDELDPSALRNVAEALADDPEVDVVYTDEDEIDGAGERGRPRFKPDWSPDLLLSTNYIGGLLVVRRSLLDEVGGPGGDRYDLVLRVTEGARTVAHVPRVAYHRRAQLPEDTADADTRALEAALLRRGERATVEPGLVPRSYRVRRPIASPAPLVSIIVPFRDGADLLSQCVESIHRTAGYDRWELVLIDNQSWEPETLAVLGRLAQDPRCRLVEYPHPYNWSCLNNFGARHANGDMLLFLNSDIEGRSPGWLAAMVEHAQRPEIGAVGARLLYGDGSVQHAGVVMGLTGSVAWHAFWKCPGERPGYLGHAKVIRNYSVVTGACMLVRRDAFDAVGGLDETLAILFNDVELCLRMRAQGYLVVYTPFAELFHYESKTRGFAVEQDEVVLMRRRWAPEIARDPYFNPNLDLRRTEFALPR